MEPVSFAVGLASILPLIAGAITTSKEYIDTVRSARKSIAALVAELEALQGSVESLHVLLKEDLYEDGSLRFHESSVLLNCSAACEAKLHSLCEKLKQERKGKIYRLLWPFTEKEHQKTLQEIRNFTNWMQFALSIDGCRLLSQTSDCVLEVMGKQLEQFKTVKSLEADTLQVLDLLKEQKLSNEARIEQETKREVLGWISTLKHYQKHQLVQKSRMKNTGSWILKRTEFSQWRDESSMSNVLVCHGIQGSGKTNLASIIIDNLLESNFDHNSPVAYFYFDHQDQFIQNTSAVLSSILKQLLEQLPTIPNSVIKFYEKNRNNSKISLPECERLLTDIATDMKCAYIVFDGLDESEHRRSFLHSIQNLARVKKMRLLVTSRPHIRDLIEMFLQPSYLQIEAHQEDLKTYIYHELEQGGIYDIADQEFVTELVRRLTLGADGMFLLPVLQLRTILNEPTLGEMENKLADLSGSLGDAFADTIFRIQRLPESRSRLGMGALMWLCHTTRALSESQLSDVLAIHGEQNAVNFKYRPATKTILECCQGLATIDGEGCIRFAHYAIREYLRDHSTEFFPHAEVTITVTCLRYLVFKDFQDGPWSTGDEIETKMAMYPFLSWAATYWGQFARRTENDSEVWSALFVFFSSPAATSVSNQVRQYSMGRRENYWDASECRSFSALHHASRHGLQRALGKLLESGAYGINERTQMGSTPIIHAVAGGHVRTARDLLAHGADPYLCNWYGDALHCAIEANHPTTVRELIHWGMDPNAVRDGNRHYLLSVLDSDAAGVLTVLIELGADMMSPSIVKAHGHLFFAAAFLGCPRVIELMLKRKWVEVEARNPKGLSAMHYAILSADMMTVRTLFDAGADIDVMDSDGRTPLDYARIENNKSMVQLLRDLGAR